MTVSLLHREQKRFCEKGITLKALANSSPGFPTLGISVPLPRSTRIGLNNIGYAFCFFESPICPGPVATLSELRNLFLRIFDPRVGNPGLELANAFSVSPPFGFHQSWVATRCWQSTIGPGRIGGLLQKDPDD